MAKGISGIHSALRVQWGAMVEALRRINPGVLLSVDEWRLFAIDHARSSAARASFNIGPLVINLPENARHANHNLFVVIKCSMIFDIEEFNKNKILVSKGFGTHAGYFRKTREKLLHVFGAHCDFDLERPAHPAFHIQLGSFCNDFSSHVKEEFDINLPAVDIVEGILKNVRLPSAELDFFAFIVQLAADHLMWEKSGDYEKSAFNELLAIDKKIIGSSSCAPWLVEGTAKPCHRANHWYAKLEAA